MGSTVLIILIVIEALVIAALLFLRIRDKKSTDAMVNNAEQLVKGKLDIGDIKVGDGDDSFSIVANGLNSIKTNMMAFVESTKKNVVILSEAVESLTASIENNQQGNELIANNSIEVDDKTMQQLDLVQNNLEVIESNSAQMQEMVAQIDIITGMLSDTVRYTDDGINYLEGYEGNMNEVSDKLNEINDTLNTFNDELKRVYDVGDFIVGISNQLKLLSFNASIEAARAGQSGKGFAVVADEMTSMSEQTKEGMDSINKILQEIMESSSKVTKSIQACTDIYNHSKDAFEKVNKSFRTISSQSSDIKNKVSEMTSMAKVVADNSEHARAMADQMHAGAQLINERTGDMTAVSEEVAAESIRISENTQALRGMLQSIQKLLKRFDTGVLPVNRKPAKKLKIAMFSMFDNEFWYGVKRGAGYAMTELADMNTEIEFIALLPKNGENLDDLVARHFKRLIEEHVDAIIFPGFLGGIETYLTRAKSEGIELMAFNCDYSNKTLRSGCLRSDSVVQGEVAGKSAVKLMNKSHEAIVLLGNPEISGNNDRNKGFRKALASVKDAKVVDEIVVADDSDDVYNKTKELLKVRKPDVLFLTNGFPLDAAKAIVDSGAAGTTKLVAYDLNPQLFTYIKQGVIGAVISQDSFGQGHDSIVWMFNQLVTGEKMPESIECRLSVADASNIDDLLEA